MPNNCVVCGRMKGPDTPNISLYRFPKFPEFRRKEWLDGLGLAENSIGTESRVCSLHFPEGKASNAPSATLGARPPGERSTRSRKRRVQGSSPASQPKRRRQHTQQASRESGASPIDPTKSYVTTTAAMAWGQAEFTLHTRDEDGKESSVQTAGVAAKLVCYKHNTIVDCTITNVQGDKCTFQYQPMSPGIHHLYVTIQGKEVHGSPQAIEVKTPKPVRIITGLSGPIGVATDSKGRVIVAEWRAHCVSIFTPEGEKVQSLETCTCTGNGNGQFCGPCGVTVDGDDNIYAVDVNNENIQKFTPNGVHLSTTPMDESSPLRFNGPRDIGFNPRNKQLYVCEESLHRIQVLNADLSFSRTFGGKGHGFRNGQFNEPSGVSFDKDGNIYIADRCNDRIQVFTPEGQYLREFGNDWGENRQLNEPYGIAIHSNNVWVTDYSDCVSVFTTSGEFLGSFGTKGDGPGEFRYPKGIAIDKNGYVLICDICNNRIQVFHLQL